SLRRFWARIAFVGGNRAPASKHRNELPRCWLILYDRLRRRRLIARSTFNLHLTQQQIGDHLGLTGETVNRVLRWFAREDIAFFDRYVLAGRRRVQLMAGPVALETGGSGLRLL